MRILHVNKFLYRRGGAEAYMEDAAALLASAGHEVAFFGMEHPANTHLELDRHFPSQVDFDPAPSGLIPRARGAARMFWSTSARRGLDAAVAEFRPDVVHLHNIYHQLSPSVLRPLRERRLASVMTLHDYKLACPTYLFLDTSKPKATVCEACLGGHFTQAVKRRCKDGSLASSALLATELAVHTKFGLYDPVTLFICPSRFIRSKMEQAGVYPDRLRLLHNFVDIPPTAAGPDPAGPIVYVGRLAEEKGADLLVRAAALLPAGRQVVIAGDGGERAGLERLAADVAPGRVTFLGRIPKEDVATLVASASVVAVPSRCYENQPLAVLDAFSAGVPVAGSGLGGISELVEDGRRGVLARPEDPADLARAITEVLADPATAHAMGAAGRALVEESYSAAAHLAGLERLYAEARDRVSAPAGAR